MIKLLISVQPIFQIITKQAITLRYVNAMFIFLIGRILLEEKKDKQ